MVLQGVGSKGRRVGGGAGGGGEEGGVYGCHTPSYRSVKVAHARVCRWGEGEGRGLGLGIGANKKDEGSR